MKPSWRETEIQMMNIINSSTTEGPGFRDVLYVSGCPHKCDGCYNAQAWDYHAGVRAALGEVYDRLTESSITNITISGGEPFEQVESLYELVGAIKENTNKTVWIYSGYTYENLVFDKEKLRLLELCDVLVDGKYEKDNTELNLRFKGSLNQRIIDIKKSLDSGEVVLADLEI